MKMLLGLFKTLWTFLTAPRPPIPTAAPESDSDVAKNLAQLILAETENVGPMPRTGGVIHLVSAETANTIAALVVKYAAVYRVPVSLAASLIKGESDFDPDAIDPNDQDAKPGESAEDAAKHADIGLAQEDVATALGLPANAKLTLAEIEANLYDPESSVIFVCHVLAENLTWAKAAVMADPTLRTMIPNGDPRVLAAQAYNSGQTGAMTIARTRGRGGPWKYGTGVVARADDWSATLDFMPHA